MQGGAGQTLSINVEPIWISAINATPLVLVLDADGQIIDGATSLLAFDATASVELTLPATGTYTVLITHLAEANGPAGVTIDLKPPTEDTESSSA